MPCDVKYVLEPSILEKMMERQHALQVLSENSHANILPKIGLLIQQLVACAAWMEGEPPATTTLDVFLHLNTLLNQL